MERHLLWMVGLNALLHELGVPVPLAPTLFVVSAGAAAGGADPLALIAAVVAATVAGNLVWFAIGRRYGSGVLKFLCRVSLSPDACVMRAESAFGRWGWSSLVVGRFIPGVSLVTPPLAGALGMKTSKFIALTTAGAALWSLVVVAAGMLLHEQLSAVLRALDGFGSEALVLIVLLIAMYAAWRYRERRRLMQNPDVPGIAEDELKRLIDRGEAPAVVDVRGQPTRCLDPRRIPGAITVELQMIEEGRINRSRA